MYSECSPCRTLADQQPIPSVEALSVLSYDVTCDLITDICNSLVKPEMVQRIYSNEVELSWILQPLSRALLLPITYKKTLKAALTVYRGWLGFLSGDYLLNTRGICVPSPIMTEPEKYAKIVFCHLPNLFQHKDYTRAEIFETGLSDHTALCEKALRALHCVGTGTSGHVLSEETWTCLLTCLLEIGNTFLPYPTQEKDLASNLCQEYIKLLFDLWLRACALHFPSASLWASLRQSCISWRHRAHIVNRWNDIMPMLTKGVIHVLYYPNNDFESSNEISTVTQLTCVEWKDNEYQEAPFHLDPDPLYQCWYRFMHTFGNPVELSYPDLIYRNLKHDANQEHSVHEIQSIGAIKVLPRIFWCAVHGISLLTELFLAATLPIALPEHHLTNKKFSTGQNVSHLSGISFAKNKLSKSTYTIPTYCSSSKANKSIHTASMYSSSVSSLRQMPPSDSNQIGCTRETKIFKTNTNTLLHLFGDWLFEACIWKYSFELLKIQEPNTYQNSNNSTFKITPISIALQGWVSQSLCATSFERGRAEAFSTLCRVICSHPCNEAIQPEYLSRFYVALIRGLDFRPGVCTGDILTSIFLSGNNLLRIDLPACTILLPHIIFPLEKILTIKRPPFSTNIQQNDLNKLRASAISLVSSMVCYPLHFLHQPITDLLSYIDPDVRAKIAKQGSPNAVHSEQVTFLSLKDKIYRIIFHSIPEETNAHNICCLLSILQVLLTNHRSFEALLSKETLGLQNTALDDCNREEDAVSPSDNDSSFKTNLETHQLCNEACQIALNTLQMWKDDFEVVLSTLELLSCVARLKLEEIDVNIGARVFSKILNFIRPPIENAQEEPQYKQQTRERHTMLVSAFNTVQQWLLAYPQLLNDNTCLRKLMEIIEIGLSGSPSRIPTQESYTTTLKDEKKRSFPSIRVLEAAESLLTTALEDVNSFPSPSGPETKCSLLYEQDLIERITPELQETVKFNYYLLNNSIIIGLMSSPFTQPNPNLSNNNGFQNNSSLPTVTMIIRCVTGKHVWTFQLRHLPRGEVINPAKLESAPRPTLSTEPLVMMPLPTESLPFCEFYNNKIKSENSIPSVEEILNNRGLRANSKEFLEFAELQREQEKEIESSVASQKSDQEYPDPLLCVEPTPPTTNYQTERLLLTSLGLLEAGTLSQLDSTKEGFLKSLSVLDTISSRYTNTVFLLYVQSSCTLLQEILQYKSNLMRTNTHFQNFIRSLGWPMDTTTHVGFHGKYPSENKSQYSVRFSSERPVIYYTDQITEIAFIFPESLHVIGIGSSNSLTSIESYESLNNSDANLRLSQRQPSRTPPENLSVQTEPGAIEKDTDSNTDLKLTHKLDSINDTSSIRSGPPQIETQKTVSYTTHAKLSTSPVHVLQGDHASTQSDTIGKQFRMKDESHSGRINLNLPMKRQKQHCSAIVIWLERFEDHINFPLDQIMQLFLFDTPQNADAHKKLKANQTSIVYPPIIFIYRLQNGLYRIFRPVIDINSSTNDSNKQIQNSFPAGPLLDGFVCSPRDLSRLVRETTINMCHRKRLTNDEYSPPESLRKKRIEDIIQRYKVVNDSQEKLMTKLFKS